MSSVLIKEGLLRNGDESLKAFEKELDQRLKGKVEWTEEESAWREFRGSGSEEAGKALEEALKEKLSGSSVAPLIDLFDPGWEGGEEAFSSRVDLALAGLEEGRHSPRDNDFCDDPKALIAGLLEGSKGQPYTLQRVLGSMEALRMTAEGISEMDESLARLDEMRVLVLAMNRIRDFSGRLLPRRLRFLELYGNSLERIEAVSHGIPERLYYLGLGRNLLDDNCKLTCFYHLEYIFYLNLEDNDFVELKKLLKVLKVLPTLRSLALVGNPCSLLIDYRLLINDYLPSLIHLDGVRTSDFPLGGSAENFQEHPKEAAVLEIHCFKLIGAPVPKPTKFKGEVAMQNFRLGIQCPLLDSGLREREKALLLEETSGLKEETEVQSVDRRITRKGRGDSSSNPRSGVSFTPEPSVAGGEKRIEFKNEEDPNKKSISSKDQVNETSGSDAGREGVEDMTFSSDKLPWARIITFPSITIPVTSASLTALRDTLRSVLYIHVLLVKSVKSKTSKATNKEMEEIIETELIAKIKISMEQIKWSTPYIGYIWQADSPDSLQPFENLRDVKILEKGQTQNTKAKHKGEAVKKEVYLTWPIALTCHIGFGLKRAHFQQTKKNQQWVL